MPNPTILGLDSFEARIRSYQSWMAPPRITMASIMYQPYYINEGVVWVGGSWADWAKLWGNIGVAHTAAVFMKEIHYDANSGTINNASAIISAYFA